MNTVTTATAPKMAYRLPEILHMYGFSKPSVYRWIKEGDFPKPVKVGRLSLWEKDIVDQWWITKTQQVSH